MLRKRTQPLSAAGERKFALEDIVGRELELARIARFFDGERGPLGLWLEGAAGIGKTTLWRAGIELAREHDYHVLTCQPTATETAFSFAALGDLLANDIADVLRELPTPQRRALEVALALASDEGASVSQHVIGLAFLSVLQLLAAKQPVLLAVDDVQWLDPPSAVALQFAMRRSGDAGIRLLVAARLEGVPRRPLQLERDLAQTCSALRSGRFRLEPFTDYSSGASANHCHARRFERCTMSPAETPSTVSRLLASFWNGIRHFIRPSRSRSRARSMSS
jgi:AAA ATPase domain